MFTRLQRAAILTVGGATPLGAAVGGISGAVVGGVAATLLIVILAAGEPSSDYATYE
jgi:tetrahydromethanopterin S-methyltransferase subunit F